jgi:thiamine transporter
MKKGETSSRTKILAEIIVFTALSAALYTMRPYSLPWGGAVTLGSMVPVMWLSLRRGTRIGFIAGAIFGVLALLIDVVLLGGSAVVATPAQVIFEYPIAFGVIGLTGVFHRKTVAFAVGGVAISVFIKFFIHYFVGVLVWPYFYTFPEEYGRWLWPAIYNGSFLAVEFIISAILISVLVKRGTLEYAL